MIPADLRLLAAKDLFVNQSALTGEAMPVEKFASRGRRSPRDDPFELPNICFMGANVVSGTATGVICAQGRRPTSAELADQIAGKRVADQLRPGHQRGSPG